MRTTLDLPDPLFRTLKAQAALQGRSLKDLVVSYVERGLREPPVPAAPQQDRSWEDRLDPFTKSLLGVAAPTDGSPLPTMDDYYAYLEKKHLGAPQP
jgi:hypothetical protein